MTSMCHYATSFLFLFPLICIPYGNLNPIAPPSPENSYLPTFSEYYEHLQQMFNCSECPPQQQVILQMEKEQLLTIEGYFQFLGDQNASHVGHKLDRFVANCELHIWEGSSQSLKSCGNLVNFTQILTPPHYNCFVARIPESIDFCKEDYESPNMSYFGFEPRYTYPTCMSTCQASGIARECGCVDIGVGHTLVKGNKTHPFCGILTKNVTELLRQKDCVQFVKSYLSWDCLFDCPTPCHENIYNTEVTQSTWPHSAFLDTFYQMYVKGKPFEYKFQSALNDIQESGCFECNEMKRISLFRDNFVKISMDLSEKFSHVLTEKPKYTIAGLISSLGGCLNLWSGITVIVAVEILECFYRLLFTKDDVLKNLKRETVKRNSQRNISLKIEPSSVSLQ